MRSQAATRTFAAVALCLVMISGAEAQIGGGAGGGLGGIGGIGGGLGGRGGGSGIVIDAEGVVQIRNERQIPLAALKKQLDKYSHEKLPASLVIETPERILSLKNLEALVQEHFERNQELPAEILYLAGLQRIDSIAFDPEQQNAYLVGPAEGFGPDNLGRMIGVTTGRPPLNLEDLVTALRAAQVKEPSIGCSIDPEAGNLARLQEYLRANSFPASVGQVQQRYRMMASVLGNQEVSVWGVPTSSHFALALVEADLRMKRIALGLEPAGVPGIRSHLSLLKPQGNSLQRWWFVPMYDPIETNPERTVFELRGQRAKLLAQEEVSDASGNRSDSALTRTSTEKFAQLFTEHFPELAAKSPAFAELQNLYDLAVLGTIIRWEGPRHLGMDPFPVLMADERLQSKYVVPRYVPSASTFRSAGSSLIGLIGGVNMDITPLVQTPRVNPALQLNSLKNSVRAKTLYTNKNAASESKTP